jgi:hypothetical protein
MLDPVFETRPCSDNGRYNDGTTDVEEKIYERERARTPHET